MIKGAFRPMPMDYFVWLARGGGRIFVIDTGFNAEVAKQRRRNYLRCPVETLAAFDIDAAHVKDVILTHLHYDHAGNFDRFAHARFHLQERELACATGRYMLYPRLWHSFEVEDAGKQAVHVTSVRSLLADETSTKWLDAAVNTRLPWAAGYRTRCRAPGRRHSCRCCR
ncbi:MULTISPECIES: MBL fold metallo-hydrolase [Bradyrhizobium]|uniref:MBL fold metallo-hydrolase n=1 Tax=Bradyrhizobium TaxID=374 RepID=UPI00366AE988